ncbi:MAG: histidine phosphatase family protein [Clostridia bacterium]|nr:histidine phosphatase family protein [Clostridia bacterium]
MLELILVRHGETTGNLRPTALGTTDLPLTERGRRQASTLARVLGLVPPTAIYTSPLKRAVETAEIIAKPHHMMAETMLDLEERHFGIWENMAVEEIRANYEAEYMAWQQDLPGYVIPQGESAQMCYERNVRFLEEIVSRHTEGKVVVVSHLGCIRNMIAHLLGMGVESGWRFPVENGRICRLQIDENGYAVLTAFNEF